MQIIGAIRTCDAKSKGVGNSSQTDGELLKELVFFILHQKPADQVSTGHDSQIKDASINRQQNCESNTRQSFCSAPYNIYVYDANRRTAFSYSLKSNFMEQRELKIREQSTTCPRFFNSRENGLRPPKTKELHSFSVFVRTFLSPIIQKQHLVAVYSSKKAILHRSDIAGQSRGPDHSLSVTGRQVKFQSCLSSSHHPHRQIRKEGILHPFSTPVNFSLKQERCNSFIIAHCKSHLQYKIQDIYICISIQEFLYLHVYKYKCKQREKQDEITFENPSIH